MQMFIDDRSKTPIYQQIVDSITVQIEDGTLPTGTKLPTIRELSTHNQVSLGTVKHAYDILLGLGLIEMTQGKGTFVTGQEQAGAAGKKDQAMLALDHLIREMRQLSFSNQEIRIFFDLKMREYEEEEVLVKVGIIDCSPELLAEIHGQLLRIAPLEITEYLLDHVTHYPDTLRKDLDLYVTTHTHFADISAVLPAQSQLMQMAVDITSSTIVELAKLNDQMRVGIIAASAKYAEVLLKQYRQVAPHTPKPAFYFLQQDTSLAAFCKEHDVLLTFTHLHQFASPAEQDTLAQFQQHGGVVIPLVYKLDQGSLFYLSQKIKALAQAING